ncbi:outer membrane protein assembly factor BamE [Hymenobacter busanensis]|uniref:Outer membrane protein assembly factor BamE n=1 Tax=Hymenobacter busanensis TaxID=2607656 RepID=A0A7L4ZUI2_9BACT|nr:outer membrane protein assembly factor BamE [Hymenobacter busanensis]KAA9339154.1 outer membrane protein assembly factor BamE [Hymenobacter busanensis]QHJ07084.1 outer membrane protein assembly factor BamE [Hymenobacter busanensis]
MLAKRLLGIVLLMLLGLALHACTAQESFQNAEQCQKVTVGMTQEQVRRLMGEPTGHDAATDGGQTWSYLFGSATDTQPIKVVFGPDNRVASTQCAPQAAGNERPDASTNNP